MYTWDLVTFIATFKGKIQKQDVNTSRARTSENNKSEELVLGGGEKKRVLIRKLSEHLKRNDFKIWI